VEVNLLLFYPWTVNGFNVYVVDYSSSYYAVRTVVVGYEVNDSNNSTLNGSQMGRQADYILCPASYLANGTGSVGSSSYPEYFYAGRISTWLLPKSYFSLGQNIFLSTVASKSLTMTIKMQ